MIKISNEGLTKQPLIGNIMI